MKYRCIKDLCGIGLFTVGKIYEIESKQDRNLTIHAVTNDYGRIGRFSDETLSTYFEKIN